MLPLLLPFPFSYFLFPLLSPFTLRFGERETLRGWWRPLLSCVIMVHQHPLPSRNSAMGERVVLLSHIPPFPFLLYNIVLQDLAEGRLWGGDGFYIYFSGAMFSPLLHHRQDKLWEKDPSSLSSSFPFYSFLFTPLSFTFRSSTGEFERMAASISFKVVMHSLLLHRGGFFSRAPWGKAPATN